MNVRGVGAPAPASWSSPALHFSSESYIFFAVLAYLSFSHCGIDVMSLDANVSQSTSRLSEVRATGAGETVQGAR